MKSSIQKDVEKIPRLVDFLRDRLQFQTDVKIFEGRSVKSDPDPHPETVVEDKTSRPSQTLSP